MLELSIFFWCWSRVWLSLHVLELCVHIVMSAVLELCMASLTEVTAIHNSNTAVGLLFYNERRHRPPRDTAVAV